jgi:hypothetical protein
MYRLLMSCILGFLCLTFPAFGQDEEASSRKQLFSHDSHVEPGNGVIHWKIVNKTTKTIALKFFVRKTTDPDREGWIWPTQKTHIPIKADDYEGYTTRNCRLGEQICYGAGYKDDPYGKAFWGIGFEGDQSCKSCCAICRRQEELYDVMEIKELKD